MSESVNYQPTCDLNALKARAKMYAQLRQFFAQRDVLEVETPVLSQAGVTDVHLASVQALRHLGGKKQTHYLQTSPEFAMKRLLLKIISVFWGGLITVLLGVMIRACFFTLCDNN